MAFDITTYVDPGPYTQEVTVPAGINIAGQPFAVTLIGTGSRSSRVTNEAVQRGQVAGEALTFSGSPARATLTSRSTRSLDHTTLYKTLNGITSVVPDAFVSFPAATISGAAGPYTNLAASSLDAFSIQLDGKVAILIHLIFVNDSSTTPTITRVGGTQFNARLDFGTALADATRVHVALCINAALYAASDLGYGSAYGNATGTTGVASGSGSVLTVTSPLTTPASDVRVFDAITHSATTEVFGATAVSATSRIEVSSLVFDALATWTVDYVQTADIDDSVDFLASTQVESVQAVGSFQGLSNFSVSNDWLQAGGSGLAATLAAGAATGSVRLTGLTGMTATSVGGLLRISGAAANPNNGTFRISVYTSATSVDVINANAIVSDANNGSIRWSELKSAIDWTPDTAAVFTSSVVDNDYDLVAATNDLIVLNFDGKRDVTVDLVQASGSDDIVGFTYALTTNSTTAQVVANINASIANDAAYGQRYNAVASGTGAAAIVLTSPTQGRASSVGVKASTTVQQAGVLEVFGLATTALPSSSVGTGQRPALGALYFVTYDHVRAASQYGVPFRSFTVSDALEQVGNVSGAVAKYNPLAIAVGLAFRNGANVVYTIQVDDADSPGTPSRAAVQAALDAAKTLEALTEIVPLDTCGTGLDVKTDLISHLETENGPTEKHFRRGWFGWAANTAVGDRDTSGTMVYQATRTLQVSPTSPARGRLFGVAAPGLSGIKMDVRPEEGGTVRLTLDSTYLAAAVAALRTALLKPSDSLTRRTVVGFVVGDDITDPWLKQERALLAGNGVLVVTHDAGRLILLDPITTEGGGGGLIQFKQDSSSYQKDNLVRKVNLALDANVVGIVPFDLANFIIDIKLIIANIISGEVAGGNCGPFRDETTGLTRNIDLRRDIIVTQSKTDPTKFFFKYWFNLLYPALRLLGEYSVDNPFFNRAI